MESKSTILPEEPLESPPAKKAVRRRFTQRSLPAWVGRIALEVFTIVFSVLLALVINEWRSIQKEKTETIKILKSMEKEMEGNLERVNASVAYSRNMLDHWEEVVEKNNGIKLKAAHPLSSAWEMAKNRNAFSSIDVALGIMLTHVYEMQQAYNVFHQNMGQILHEENVRPVENAKPHHRGYYHIIEDYQGYESVLKSGYEEILPLIRKEIERLEK